jgi:hypothetical protein
MWATAVTVVAAVFGLQHAAGLFVAPLFHSPAKMHFGVSNAFSFRQKPDLCFILAGRPARSNANDDDSLLPEANRHSLLWNTVPSYDSATVAVVSSSKPNSLATSSSAPILRRDWMGAAAGVTTTVWALCLGGGSTLAPLACNAATTDNLSNDDPLAAFGMQMQQASKMDLVVRPVVVVESTQSSQWPRAAAHPLPSNRGLDDTALPMVEPGPAAAANGGLLDAIEQARSKKQVNPRTHG